MNLNSFLKYAADRHIYPFLVGDKEQTSRTIKNLFPHASLEKIARGAGAIDGSIVNFSAPNPNSLMLKIKLLDEGRESKDRLFDASRTYHKVGEDPYKDIILEHNTQIVNDPTLLGKGHERFKEQLGHLRDLGVKGIHIESGAGTGGPEGSVDGWNGYYTFPRYGFNGRITKPQIARLPKEIQDQLRTGNPDFHHLFSIKGGPEAWKRYGTDTNELDFSLDPNDPHIQKFQEYYNKRQNKQ